MDSELIFLLSIASLLSALLYVILKYFEIFKIENIQGLTFNYITAATLSFIIGAKKNEAAYVDLPTLLPYAIGLGLLFIVVFYTAALSSQKSGIAVTSIAGKMSMVIPITAGFILYSDKITTLRLIGIALALVAVYLASKPADKGKIKIEKATLILPLLLFIGSGLVDTSIKYSQFHLLNSTNQNFYFSLLFGSAGFFGLIIMIGEYLKNKKGLQLKSILAGLILGITNYYSLEFLVNCLAYPGAESALIWPVANVLVVIFSVILGLALFKEKFNKTKVAGIAFAILAIIVLAQ
jgi:drug/metabolite transporter (DMT)-like permease